jgi:hypothetical protein
VDGFAAWLGMRACATFELAPATPAETVFVTSLPLRAYRVDLAPVLDTLA